MHDGGDRTKEFHVMRGLRRVSSIPHKFPKNIIIYILIEVHILQLDPKVDELGEVIHGEVVTPC
jgi:uncharacterized protein YacL